MWFKFMGIPVRLNFSAVVLFFLGSYIIYSTVSGVVELPAIPRFLIGAAGSVCLILSILWHERGHILAASRYGIGCSGITLFMFGGMAHLDSAPNTSRASFWIAIAGPIASFIAAAGLFGAHILLDTILLAESIISQTLLTFAGLNFVLGAFNLLMPVFPLDGGQVLYSALWKMKGDALTALHLCVRIGRWIIVSIFVFALVPLAVVGIVHPISFLWYLLIALFIWQIQPANLRA